MEYTIKAKETLYAGYRMRSRLEAKWAAFFDILGWKWDYEPIDFNSWSPDFAIYGDSTVYVEVKPITELDSKVVKKINSSGCSKTAIIVGATCPMKQSGIVEGQPTLGWIGEILGPNKNDRCWESAEFGTWDGKTVGFCNPTGSWTDYITGSYGKYYLRDMPVSIEDCWAKATNRVRFEVWQDANKC